VKRAKFVAAARREFLFEVVYYNKDSPGLARVSLRPSRTQRHAPWRSRLLVRPHPKTLGESLSRTFLFLLCIGQMPTELLSLRSRIIRVGRNIGNRVLRTANKSYMDSSRNPRLTDS